MTLSQRLGAWMAMGFRDVLGDDLVPEGAVQVVPATQPEFGDYQCNASMALAKKAQRAPRDVASDVVAHLGEDPLVESVNIAGPGFLNIRLQTSALAAAVEALATDARLGVPQVGVGRRVIIDYSSPNVAKPMHIGHIRSTIIGAAIDRLHRCLGYDVIADNHVGDWGTQFGILIQGFRGLRPGTTIDSLTVEALERIYVESYERSESDPEWKDACREALVKLQAGDADSRQLWQHFVDLSLKEFDRTYGRLGVAFDLVRGESYYNDRLPGVLDLLKAKGLVERSEGADVVFLEDEGLAVCIVRKSDGGFNYASTDLATVGDRLREFAPEKIIYVTDERQRLHFQQIFSICGKLGYDVQLVHVRFGLMRLPEGTFSTRQGNVIKLERMLDEAEERALAIVKASSPEMAPDVQRDVARAVGIGAVKYADLSQNPETNITFTWDKALSLEGNSGPYLQYAHARIASVRDKYSVQCPGKNPDAFPLCLETPVERSLALQLVGFPDVITRAAQSYKPSMLAEALYTLTQTYSSFYQNVPFLKAPEGIRESRVKLCGVIARVLCCGLELLGIEAPDRI